MNFEGILDLRIFGIGAFKKLLPIRDFYKKAKMGNC
jgi:hypothetical protein